MTLALEVAEESIEEGGIVPSERDVGKSRPDERVGDDVTEEVFDRRGLVVDDEEEEFFEEEAVEIFEVTEFVEKFNRDKDLAKTADCNLLKVFCCMFCDVFQSSA